MFELNIGNGSLTTPETMLLNSDQKSNVQDKIDAISTLANCIVKNEGFITITRQTEIVSAKGTPQSFLYQTYITYLSQTTDGFVVALSKSLCKREGTSMLHFSNFIHDERLHENFFGQDEPEKKIVAAITQHYILEKQASLSKEEIEELEKYRDEQLSQSKSIYKKRQL